MTGSRPPGSPRGASAAPTATAGGPDRPRWAAAPPLSGAQALTLPILASHGHSLWTEWGALEWSIVAVGGAISLWVIWLAVRHTFRPGEEADDHVKRSILADEDRALEPRVASPARPPPLARARGLRAPAAPLLLRPARPPHGPSVGSTPPSRPALRGPPP